MRLQWRQSVDAVRGSRLILSYEERLLLCNPYCVAQGLVETFGRPHDRRAGSAIMAQVNLRWVL